MKYLGLISILLFVMTNTYFVTVSTGHPIDQQYISYDLPKYFEKRLAEDDDILNTLKTPWTGISLTKRNSEIISALMGLRRAMAKQYTDHHVY
ncbi:uncharacterized protein LOC126838838 [Adelges cooleyi]|uniref:uncharacterized protein LOC126838838 n=1 Tax=Adelges cooleyi TaxID=133065 RepID=UPI00217FE6B1|nr:uncharacterized protein LOC126838838 [Adelges cooleyi]